MTARKKKTRSSSGPKRGASRKKASRAAAAPARSRSAARAGETADRRKREASGRRAASAELPQAGPVSAGRRASRLEEDRGKYVYCIIRTGEPLRFGMIGIGDEPAEVHTIHYKDVAAVASDTPIEVLDPTRENVLSHERVNETVMRHHTVIPMSFGTVFKTAEDIVELLRSAYDAFHDVLVQMQNKVEYGLKVLWDPEIMLKVIEDQDEDIRRLKREISSQKGSTYFARMQYGRLVDAALQSRSELLVADIFEQLRDVAVASRTNKPIGDKMILNSAFLVSRDKEGAFDTRVKRIGAKYDKLTFKYTGPWPPYNFVNIRLKLERAKDAE